MNRVAGIILAAGASQRMGTPKALLDYRGETFLTRLVRVLGTVCDPVIAVLGHHADVLRPALPPAARIAINPDPDRGQLSSLQAALAELPPDAGGFAFLPVDCPAVEAATVARIAKAFTRRAPDTLFVIPRMGGKRGHPVFATRAIAEQLLTLPPTAAARDVVHEHVPRTEYVEVADPGIFTDIDTPEAYRRLLEEAAR